MVLGSTLRELHFRSVKPGSGLRGKSCYHTILGLGSIDDLMMQHLDDPWTWGPMICGP